MADLNLGSYSAESVSIIIGVAGQSHKVSGIADGTFVEITPAIDVSTMRMGADRSGYRVFNANRAASISLTLGMNSSTNDFLTQIHNNDAEARNSRWLFSMFIKDTTGRSWSFAAQCFIAKKPTQSFSTNGEDFVWEIQSLDVEQHNGGNALIDPSVVQAIEAIGGTVDDAWKA